MQKSICCRIPFISAFVLAARAESGIVILVRLYPGLDLRQRIDPFVHRLEFREISVQHVCIYVEQLVQPIEDANVGPREL